MNCQKCKSGRVLDISGKCSDCCSYELNGKSSHGYVPDDMGVGGGDYLEIMVCLDCGQLQGTWPLPETKTEQQQAEEDEHEKEVLQEEEPEEKWVENKESYNVLRERLYDMKFLKR